MTGLTVKPNGEFIRKRRLAKGWSQNHLATICIINERTVQRAENSEGISHETAAQIAAQLGLLTHQIIEVQEDPSGDHAGPDWPDDANLVVLHRTESARHVIEGLCKSHKHVIDCDADPTLESVEHLVSFVEMLEALAPYQDSSFDVPLLSHLSSRIRFTADFAGKMTALAHHGINIFYGEYIVLESPLCWNLDRRCWVYEETLKPEPCTVSTVLLSANPDRKVVRRIQAAPLVENEDDEEIPF